MAGFDQRTAQRDCQVGFADAWRAKDQHILRLREKAAGG